MPPPPPRREEVLRARSAGATSSSSLIVVLQAHSHRSQPQQQGRQQTELLPSPTPTHSSEMGSSPLKDLTNSVNTNDVNREGYHEKNDIKG
ncbi:hypothetical protein U9M48_023564 [Paspalum notatum var. saurae]|uniref:Uncharacterized protein n=1 Tax=Paspalum notatum var. saurae TaxID=547442 RepID=A0AAQ3TP52_PASNO